MVTMIYAYELHLINGIYKHNTRFGVLVGQQAVGELNKGVQITHNITLKQKKVNSHWTETLMRKLCIC